VPAGAALAAVLVPAMVQHLGLPWAFLAPGIMGLLAAVAFTARSAQELRHTAQSGSAASTQASVWSLLATAAAHAGAGGLCFSGLQVTTLAMLVPFLHGFQQMSIEQAGLLSRS
jgi:hypothetical protein